MENNIRIWRERNAKYINQCKNDYFWRDLQNMQKQICKTCKIAGENEYTEYALPILLI